MVDIDIPCSDRFLPGIVVIAILCFFLRRLIFPKQRSSFKYSNFDNVIHRAEAAILPDDDEARRTRPVLGEDDDDPLQNLNEPLTNSSSSSPPPTNHTYHLEDKQFGIQDEVDKKASLEGLSLCSTLRLFFTESKNGCFSLQGSRTISSPSSSSSSKEEDEENVNSTTTTLSSTFVIQKGMVHGTSKKAFWEESEGGGIRRVVMVQFDSNYHSFSGEWLASNGMRGSLMSYSNEDES